MKFYVTQDGYFVLHHVIPNDDDQLEKDLTFTTWEPTEKIRAMAEARNCENIYTALWSSKATHDDLAELLRLIDGGMPARHKIFAHLHIFDVNPCFLYELDVQFFTNSEHNFFLSHERAQMRGRQLLVTLFVLEEPDLLLQKTQMQQLVSLMRLQMGLDFAITETLSNYFNVKTNKASSTKNHEIIPEIHKEWIDKSALRAFDAPSSSLTEKILRPDLAFLFNKSTASSSPYERFLYLWICFEIIAGNGKEREKLFLREIKSLQLNNEAKRLHQIRSAIAHEGERILDHKDCISLLSIYRIAATTDLKIRATMVKEYEKSLALQ